MVNKKIEINSLYSFFERGKDLYGNKTLYRFNKKDGEVVDVSYKEMYELITDFSLALKSLGLEGKKIILLGETSVQWITTYLSAITTDSIIVPIDPLLLEEEIIKFVNYTKATYVVTSKQFEETFIKNEDKMPLVEKIIITDKETFTLYPEEEYVNEKITTFNNILSLGRYLKNNSDIRLNTFTHDTNKMSVLLFTSGTTGSSKGVMISERNICAVLEGIYPLLYGLTPDDSVLSVLPIYHTYEMSAGILAPMLYGMTICISDGLKYVGKNIKQFQPTVMVLVPLFANQLHKTIEKNVKKMGKERTVAIGGKISGALLKLHIDARRRLFRQVLNGLGGRIKAFIVGGAALDPKVAQDFEKFGIQVRQGYGITECAPLISVVPLNEKNNPKSCGKLMPGMQIFIDKEKADDQFGEIVVKGDNVMLGYYEDEEQTFDVLKDGWFRTGDYGYIDSDGYIYITGRKKNVIVSQGGKNIFPEELEEYLDRIPLVEESVVVGNTDPDTGYVTTVAIVYPNYEECTAMGFVSTEEIQKAISDEVQNINKRLASYKHIGRIEIRTEPFEKTTSRKIKRHTIYNNQTK